MRGEVASRVHRLGVVLAAPIKAGPYLSITVTEASHAGIALASALVDVKRFDRAESVLRTRRPGHPRNHQWRQYVRSHLMSATQRWPDVIAEATRGPPTNAVVMSAVSAGIMRWRSTPLPTWGRPRVSLERADRAADLVDPGAFL